MSARILIITDTWRPQINGVVRTIEAVANELERKNCCVGIIGPKESRRAAFRCPFYPEIVLEFFGYKRLKRAIEAYNPDGIHIATEGPLGWAARKYCLRKKCPFTTAYHTRFPEYIAVRAPKPLAKIAERLAYALLRRFHAPSKAVLVATATMENELNRRRFKNIKRWSRGVDTQLYQPYGKTLSTYAGLPRPILLYVGRVSVEKNLPAFLDIKTNGSKVIIGDGPDLAKLKEQYPGAHFLGAMEGETLARHYAAADLFVFPSKTDTFGLVLLEACACGLRIASFPAPGPLDLFMSKEARHFAVLGMDLQNAVDGALRLKDNPDAPRRFAGKYSWANCAEQFLRYQSGINRC